MKPSEQAVADLVENGAMLTPAVGAGAYLVGLMRCLSDGRWFWWEAGGVDEFAGHVVEPDTVNVLYDGLAVAFYRRGELVGYLTTIKEALDDENDSANVSRILREWFAEYERNENLRGFIERQITSR